MAIHYFHCTDGVDMIVDRKGREGSGARELTRSARDTAEAVMRAVPSYDSWEAWSVYIYNEHGQVAIVPFLPGLDEHAVPVTAPDLTEVGPAPFAQAAMPRCKADRPALPV
ncbi:MAG TPA: hypothetical protein VGC68_09910 [Enterovirga sp.]|jgi:hypothetical protein